MKRNDTATSASSAARAKKHIREKRIIPEFQADKVKELSGNNAGNAKMCRPNKRTGLIIGAFCGVAVLTLVGFFFIFGNTDSKDALLRTTQEVQEEHFRGGSIANDDGRSAEVREVSANDETKIDPETATTLDFETDASMDENTLSVPNVPDAPVDSEEIPVQTSVSLPETKSATTPQLEPEPDLITVNVRIDGSRGGGAVSRVTVSVPAASSVCDALYATDAQVYSSGGYVSAINGLSEVANGPGSGWIYFVDGVSPGYSSASYELRGGESIDWIYTLDFGNDI